MPDPTKVSDASVIPRVGVAVFVFNEKGHILLGKRTGSHGSGTLALPGGHLELHESFQECAFREVLEETGIELDPSTSEAQPWSGISFVTAVNSVHMRDHGETQTSSSSPPLGRHYVTIFMKARATLRPGQETVQALVTEPEKCLGWVWVPWSYLRAMSVSQSSIEEMKRRAESEGNRLPVGLEKLLRAERLAEAMSVTGDRDDLKRERRVGVAHDGLGPLDDEEAVAWAQADEFAQGSPLFQPLVNFLVQNPHLGPGLN
ncbi:hypothetical protein IE53DRAFT_412627 [Violaceomyces palustris]|uniref:Uncharacterized protein n=1 Tax=Violaceomyces palustris TaxID=1673888 RepID=A0ACD0NQD2_9BASI|nr:hypothetical protein IE53DRAFT_412627 [Violaceomyces palustris]